MSDSFSQGVGQPCANPECNFTGHAGFENYCSVCYKLQLNKNAEPKTNEKEEKNTDKMEIEAEEAKVDVKDGAQIEDAKKDSEAPPAKKVQKNRKRCFKCKKKVGYTGFECRCTFVFCGSCRMPEDHECDFDFAAHDRANLAKGAQKVEASKLNAL